MRSLEEILRTYNVVNSRSGSRYTVRFTAAALLAGVFVVAASMLLMGTPQQGGGGGDFSGAMTDPEDGDDGTGTARDPLVIGTVDGADWTYVGYPLADYDPAQKDRYDAGAVERAVLEWIADHPEVPLVGAHEPVHDPNGDGVLMGYMLRHALAGVP